MDFEAFRKIPRTEKMNLSITVTEKLDGTNACVAFDDDGKMFVGSRNRWLQPEGIGPKGCDNFGFAAWCAEHEAELRFLGPGRHYGEWYGRGISHGYGLQERRLALFNTRRWGSVGQMLPECLSVVPVLWSGYVPHLQDLIDATAACLTASGSVAVPGWMEPEGLVVYLPGFDASFKHIIHAPGGARKARPSPIE